VGFTQVFITEGGGNMIMGATASKTNNTDPFIQYSVMSLLLGIVFGIGAVFIAPSGLASFGLLWVVGSLTGVSLLTVLCLWNYFFT
jgi:hypothetical protein